MLADDHKYKVEDPNDVPAEQEAQKRRNDLSFHQTGNESADERGYGNDRKDHADKIAKTEIIAFFCHVGFLLIKNLILLLYYRIMEMSMFLKKK